MSEYIDSLASALPAELQEYPVWLLWKKQTGTDLGDKPKKVPFYADGGTRKGKLDSPQDRARLVTFETAADAFLSKSGFEGLGAALGEVPETGVRLAGIDFDAVYSGDQLDPRVSRVIQSVVTYTEQSVSGAGVHVIGTGKPGTTKRDSRGLEIYDHGRYFTFSGRMLTGAGVLANIEPAATLARELFMAGAGAVKEGGRNNALYAFACGLRGRGLSEQDARTVLYARNASFDPPLATEEVEEVFGNAWKRPAGFALTDFGNAERLIAHVGEDWRWLPELGWCRFDGVRWEEDREQRITIAAAEVARRMLTEAAAITDNDTRRRELTRWALQSESRSGLSAMEALARPQAADLLDRYDNNPLLLAVRNGVLDFQADEFRAGRREDRLRLRADVEFDPAARAPLWEKFLQETFAGDTELIEFVQRAAGYSATGSTGEQVLFIAHGAGANGKSTFIAVLRRLLGEYAKAVQPETLMARDRGGVPNDIARLAGVRFAPTVEVEDGRRLAESIVKQLTGGDAVSARFMRREFFDFVPVVKLWIVTNHRPQILGTDHAIWRRLLMIPFAVTVPKERRDKDLEAKLFAEAPGILNWLRAGVKAWRARGLDPPEAVRAATEKYRADMDRVGVFLKERCRVGLTGRTKKTAVYAAYRQWCTDGHYGVLSKGRFHEKLQLEHGFSVVLRDGYDCYEGVLLIDESMEEM